MNWKRMLSTMVVAAMLATGSLCCAPAFAEEDFEEYYEDYSSDHEEESSDSDDSEDYEEPEAPATETREEIGSDDEIPPVKDESATGNEDSSDGDDEDIPPVEPEGEDNRDPEQREDNPDESVPEGMENIPINTEDPEALPEDPEALPEDPEALPEELEDPELTGKVSISMSGASARSVVPGQKVSFGFNVSNAVALSYKIVGPDGSTAEAGHLSADASSVSFTPSVAGTYTLVLLAEGADGETVSADASVSAEEVPELYLNVTADAECCLGGESISFTLSVPEGLEITDCRIAAYQNSNEFYKSSHFESKVTVTPPAVRKVTDVMLRVAVMDVLGRVAEASATIPCAVNERESRAEWEATMRGVHISGVWPKDLIAIAKTQVGYKESSVNFGVKHGGGISGYTRYGDWAGMRYDEWCAMFASFCLHYAGITEDYFPYASNCQRWIEKLSKKDLYAPEGTYIPRLGDLVFFEWENDHDSDHVGIIYRLDTDSNGYVTGFTTIEGNSTGGAVRDDKYYSITDSRVVGYGLVNNAYEKVAGLDIKPGVSEADTRSFLEDVGEDTETTTEDDDTEKVQNLEEDSEDSEEDSEDNEEESSKTENKKKQTQKTDDDFEEDTKEPKAPEADFAEVKEEADDTDDETEKAPPIEAEGEIITEEEYLDSTGSEEEQDSGDSGDDDAADDNADGDLDGEVQEDSPEEAHETKAPVEVSLSVDGLTITARAESDTALPEGASMEVSEIRAGEDAFNVFVDALRGELGENEDLGNARMIEVHFFDEDGDEVIPQGPVELTVAYDGSLNASKALRPCVATIGGASGISINSHVSLSRSQEGSSYTFTQSDFSGVICTYVAGKLKYRTDTVEAACEGVAAKLGYSAEAKVPSGASLTLREIAPGTQEYEACLSRVSGNGGANVRFFEAGLELNGMNIEPEQAVKLTFIVDQAADFAAITRIHDGATFSPSLEHKKNGSTAVSFEADGLGIFALSLESAAEA